VGPRVRVARVPGVDHQQEEDEEAPAPRKRHL
jgi:hypothetical protein